MLEDPELEEEEDVIFSERLHHEHVEEEDFWMVDELKLEEQQDGKLLEELQLDDK